MKTIISSIFILAITAGDGLQAILEMFKWCLLNGAQNEAGVYLAILTWLGLLCLIAAIIAPIVKLILVIIAHCRAVK